MPRIPFTIVTGFLGSGKTSLINSYLKRHRSERVLVMVNELGDVGVDHDLIFTATGQSAVALPGGCLCCAYRGAIGLRLREALLTSHANGCVNRIIIETSGLASPVGVERELMSDPELTSLLRIAGVVACLDVFTPPWNTTARATALRQLALADQIVLTKGELAPQQLAATARFAAQVNPTAVLVQNPAQSISEVLSNASLCASDRWEKPLAATNEPAHPEVDRLVLRPPAWPLGAVYDRLARLCAIAGDRLLRLKGFIRPRGTSTTYAVQTVAGFVYPLVAMADPARLEPRLVLIGTPGLKVAIAPIVLDWAKDE